MIMLVVKKKLQNSMRCVSNNFLFSTDINECIDSNIGVASCMSHGCVNTNGGYTCMCRSGYQHDGSNLQTCIGRYWMLN